MFEVSGSEKTFAAVIDQYFSIFRTTYPDIETAVWNELEEEFEKTSMDQLIDMLIPIYEKYLTEDDLKAIIDFYTSDAGKKYAEKTPAIMQESMVVGQEWGMSIAEAFNKKLEERSIRTNSAD